MLKHTLGSLLEGIFDLKERHKGSEVNEISVDTREAKPGDLFIFKKGENFDSHGKYKIMEGFANAFLSEKKLKTETSCVVVEDKKKVLAKVASRFYGCPNNHITNITITGTNGKTSVSYLVSHILRNNGDKDGIVERMEYS